MSLQDEINQRSKEIYTEGYPMSIGELINLYRDKEIDIHPEFQRVYRWTDLQKTKLIESILLGIPIPPIFVSQRENGVWDVIDGMQRLSTILQFVGELKKENEEKHELLQLLETKYLPALKDKYWNKEDDADNSFTQDQRLFFKRAKLDIKIIKKESDPLAKYELFQRLNTGGTRLSDQEVRNCLLLMINPGFYKWLKTLSEFEQFKNCVPLTDNLVNEQYDLELVLRFFIYKKTEPDTIRATEDIGDFITKKMIEFAEDPAFDYGSEEENFKQTFSILSEILGENSFRRFDSGRYRGTFLITAFEAIAIGVSHNINPINSNGNKREFVERHSQELYTKDAYISNSTRGARAATRFKILTQLGRELFANEN